MKPEKVTAHPSSEARRSKLGEILVENGAITVSQLEHALAEQSTLKLPLGQILLKLDYVTDETMRQALGLQLNVPYLDLENVMIDRSLARVINPTYAKKHSLLPVATVGRTLTVAMDDPTATAVVQDLSRLTGFSITVVTSSSRAILRAFKRLYDDVPDGSETVRPDAERPLRSQMIGAFPETDAIVGSHGDLVLHELIRHALDAGASDVHLDVSPSGVAFRLRIGGVLKRAEIDPLQVRLSMHAQELLTRINAFGRQEDRSSGRPHVARGEYAVDRAGHGPMLDLKVSILPTRRGQSVVIRLLDRTAAPRTLDAIGLPANILTRLSERLARTAGVVLVTGPATLRASELLHACALELARGGREVLTAEDPIAFVNEAVTQTEVGVTTGTTLSSQLRAFLQHDTDAILVSDLPDRDSAALAFRAAQSGRLVLAGFAVGNCAADAVPCLVDLGLPSSAIAQSLVAVLHQRSPAGFELWTPDGQDAQLILQGATFGDILESARRTTIAAD
jgi:MSHA biogenesis protein MshE